jgi:hypothetical protein
METMCSSETSVDLQRSARSYIAENRTLSSFAAISSYLFSEQRRLGYCQRKNILRTEILVHFRILQLPQFPLFLIKIRYVSCVQKLIGVLDTFPKLESSISSACERTQTRTPVHKYLSKIMTIKINLSSTLLRLKILHVSVQRN